MGLPMLKQIRMQRGLSRAALGALLEPKVTGQAVYYWEAGDRSPDIETLRALARILGCDPGALLGETELPAATGGAA